MIARPPEVALILRTRVQRRPPSTERVITTSSRARPSKRASCQTAYAVPGRRWSAVTVGLSAKPRPRRIARFDHVRPQSLDVVTDTTLTDATAERADA